MTLFSYKKFIVFSTIILTTMLFLSYLYTSYIFLNMDTFPLKSDEYGYFLNVKNFIENHSLASAFTLDEKYSRLGAYSFHGFGYTLLYGMIAIFLHTDNIMTINIVLAWLSLFIVWFIKFFTVLDKLLFSAILLSYFIFYLYSFSFMVENIHILGTIIITILMYQVFLTQSKKYIILLILLVLLFSILRQTWIIFLFPLLFVSKDKKELYIYMGFIILGVIFVLLDLYLFHASYPNAFITKLFHLDHWKSLLFIHTKSNITHFFTDYISLYYYSTKTCFIFLILYTMWRGIRLKSNFLFAVSLVALSYFIALILFYDAQGWREQRVFAVPYISMILALLLNKERGIVLIILIVQAISFPSITKMLRDTRTSFYIARTEQHAYTKVSILQKTLLQLSIPKNKTALIIFDRYMEPLDYNPLFERLPTHTQSGGKLQYSLYYFEDINASKTKATYLLSKKNYPMWQIVKRNKDFFLYKNPIKKLDKYE